MKVKVQQSIKTIGARARSYLTRSLPNIADAATMVPALAGLALISFGVALIYLPAGFIVGGLCLLWIDARLP